MTAVPQSQTSISRRTLDIEDYIDIARRHISWIIGPLYAGIVISTMVAFFLPNVYISRAVLRITPSAIPENLVPAVFNQQMQDRISQMWQEVISRSQLSELIQRPTLNLYPSERNHKPLEDVLEDMKSKDIRLEITSLNQNANGGKPNSTFQISFKYPERFKAQAVVSALVAKLTDANQNAQRTNVNLTRDLMSDELKQAKDDMDKVDQELTAFKVANSGRLPEQLQLNVSAMTALQTRLTSINDALQRIAEQKLMDEDRLTSAKAMVSQMEIALNQTPQEEMATTHEERRQNQDLLDLDREISLMDAKLAVDQQNYTEKHPDVIDDKQKLKILRQRREQLVKEDTVASAAATSAAADASKKKSPPPKRGVSLQNQQALSQSKAAISQTEAQMTALEMERNEKVKEQGKINEQLAAFQARIEASPINEQKYASLMQQRRQAEEHYDGLMKKSQLAEQGVAVTERKAGETLEMLDTASLPETPAEPNRWQIVAIGSFAGLLVGLMMAGAKEMKDTSLKNLKDVRAYTNLPVLSSIPLLENALLVRRKRRLAYVAWAVAVIAGLCGTAIAVYYHFQISNK
jgi:succinoglycan biosynthesis transport protein ExoP